MKKFLAFWKLFPKSSRSIVTSTHFCTLKKQTIASQAALRGKSLLAIAGRGSALWHSWCFIVCFLEKGRVVAVFGAF
jgi:hypothetical protein